MFRKRIGQLTFECRGDVPGDVQQVHSSQKCILASTFFCLLISVDEGAATTSHACIHTAAKAIETNATNKCECNVDSTSTILWVFVLLFVFISMCTHGTQSTHGKTKMAHKILCFIMSCHNSAVARSDRLHWLQTNKNGQCDTIIRVHTCIQKMIWMSLDAWNEKERAKGEGKKCTEIKYKNDLLLPWNSFFSLYFSFVFHLFYRIQTRQYLPHI